MRVSIGDNFFRHFCIDIGKPLYVKAADAGGMLSHRVHSLASTPAERKGRPFCVCSRLRTSTESLPEYLAFPIVSIDLITDEQSEPNLFIVIAGDYLR